MATRKKASGTVPNLILVFENGKLAVVGKRLPKRTSKKRATKRRTKKRATKRPAKKRATKKKAR